MTKNKQAILRGIEIARERIEDFSCNIMREEVAKEYAHIECSLEREGKAKAVTHGIIGVHAKEFIKQLQRKHKLPERKHSVDSSWIHSLAYEIHQKVYGTNSYDSRAVNNAIQVVRTDWLEYLEKAIKS